MQFYANSHRFWDTNVYNLQKVGYCREIQVSHGCYSIAIIRIRKSRPIQFCAAALTVSELLMFQIIDIKNVGQGHWVEFS